MPTIGLLPAADQAHHLDVSRDAGGAGELGVAMHTAHRVGQAIGGRAGRDVVRVQGTAGAAARSDREVLLAVLDGPLL